MKNRYIVSQTVARAVLLCAVAGFAVSAQPNAEWRQFRGPNGSGISGDSAINLDWQAKPPAKLWSVPLNDAGWANPCVANGMVFLLDHQAAPATIEDIVRALDLKTGRGSWTFSCPGLSKNQNGFTGASPAFDDNRVYVISRLLLVTCLDAQTGQKIWQRDCAAEFTGAKAAETAWGFNASPLVDENRLILVPGAPDAAVVALNKVTGETIWKTPGRQAAHASPIIYRSGDAKQYVIFNSEGLVGINPVDGKRLWTAPHTTQFNQNSATPIVVGNRIFMTSAFNVGSALVDVADNKPSTVWSSKELQSRFSSPVCIKDCIYGVTQPENPGSLVCLDSGTGKVNWKQPGFEFGPISAAGGAILALNGKTGDVVLIEANAEKYNELGRIKLAPEGAAWNLPIVAGGNLLVRTKKNLFCFNVAP